jgi:hypothetical protein
MSESTLVLSGSSLNTFLRCGKQWEYAYVLNLKRPPNIRQLVGLATHEAIEVDMRQKLETRENLPVDDVLDAYSTAFNRDAGDIEDPEEPIGDAKDSGVKLVLLHRDEVASKVQPALVEAQVQFEVDGIPYSGYLDLVDDEGYIRDTKTSARKLDPDTYRLAMTGYAVGWRQSGVEQGLDYDETFESGVVLDGLIRTKKPYYQREDITINEVDIKRFAGVVTAVSDAINAGTFVPNGVVSGACGWCGYADICPAYRGVK